MVVLFARRRRFPRAASTWIVWVIVRWLLHLLNVIGFKNKAPGSIARDDYIRRDKLRFSIGFAHSSLSQSYQRSEENNQVLQTTDRFLVKHGIGAKCLHCGIDLSLASVLGALEVDVNNENINDQHAESSSQRIEITVSSDDEGSAERETGLQSTLESGDAETVETKEEEGQPFEDM